MLVCCVSVTEFWFLLNLLLKLCPTVLIHSTYMDICYHVLSAFIVNVIVSKNSVLGKVAPKCLGPEERDMTLSHNYSYCTNSHWKILLLFMAIQISLRLDCLGFVWIGCLTLNSVFWKFPLSLRNITLGNWILKSL